MEGYHANESKNPEYMYIIAEKLMCLVHVCIRASSKRQLSCSGEQCAQLSHSNVYTVHASHCEPGSVAATVVA